MLFFLLLIRHINREWEIPVDKKDINMIRLSRQSGQYMCMMNLTMDGLLAKRRSVGGILWL